MAELMHLGNNNCLLFEKLTFQLEYSTFYHLYDVLLEGGLLK